MKHSMLHSSYIEIDRHPVLFLILAAEFLAVMRIKIPKIIPAGTSPLRHCIGLSPGLRSTDRTGGIDPFIDSSQRALPCTGRLIILNLGKLQRKLIIWNRNNSTMRTMYKWNRFTPVSLSGEYPVTELVVHHLLSTVLLFQPYEHLGYCFLFVQPIKETAVNMDSVLSPRLLLNIDFALKHFNNRKVELFGKFPVSVVMSWNSHDSSGSI